MQQLFKQMEQTLVSSTATHTLLSALQDAFLSWVGFLSLVSVLAWGSWVVPFGILILSLEDLIKKMEKSSGA